MVGNTVCPSRYLHAPRSTESKCSLIDLAATWCSSAASVVPEIILTVAAASARKVLGDIDVKLAFLRVAADAAVRLQRISRDATDYTNAPPARIKDTPNREIEHKNVLKNFFG